MASPFSGGVQSAFSGGIGNMLNSATGGSAGGPQVTNFGNGFSGAGNYGTHIANSLGFGNQQAQSAWGNQQTSIGQQNATTQGIVNQMGANGQNAVGQGQQNTNAYNNQTATDTEALNQAITSAQSQLTGQANNSKAAYTNNVLPQLQTLQSQSMNNAQGAMTLAQAQSPNNAVEQGVQGMYNTQAQGIQSQGLADYGVLAALGSQATAGTIGASGLPVTGAQMATLQNSNLGQASQAFGNAQNTANNLKTQGLQAGINQSNWAYGQGQNAIQSAAGLTQAYAGANDQMNNIQNQYTQEGMGLSGQSYNAGQSMAAGNYNANQAQSGLQYGMGNQNLQNQLGAANQTYGSQQAIDQAQAQAASQAQAGKVGAIGGIAGAGIGYGMGTQDSVIGGNGGGGGGIGSFFSSMF